MKENTKNLLIIAAIFLTLLLVVLIVGIKFSMKELPSETIGNTAGNLNNGGLFCEYNGKVYFSNANDHGTLYVMNPDETEIQKLSDSIVKYINASDYYLVYYQEGVASDDDLSSIVQQNGIFRTNLNGKEADCIDDCVCTALVLTGNNIYYQHYDNETYTTLYKSNLLGNDQKEIDDAIINPHCVSNSTIYFNGTAGDHYLYGLNTNTDTINTIWTGNIRNPVISGNYVYYMDLSNHYGLSRYSLLTNEVEILTHDRVDFFNLAGNMIYYQTAGKDNQALKRMHLDGSNNEIVREGIHENINVTSRYVYFNEFSFDIPVYHTPVNGGPVTIFQPES